MLIFSYSNFIVFGFYMNTHDGTEACFLYINGMLAYLCIWISQVVFYLNMRLRKGVLNLRDWSSGWDKSIYKRKLEGTMHAKKQNWTIIKNQSSLPDLTNGRRVLLLDADRPFLISHFFSMDFKLHPHLAYPLTKEEVQSLAPSDLSKVLNKRILRRKVLLQLSVWVQLPCCYRKPFLLKSISIFLRMC